MPVLLHLLPGSMIKNDHLKFICRDQTLRVENNRTPWTSDYALGQEITVPLKNQDGQYIADERTLDELEGEGRVVVPLRRPEPERLAPRHRRHLQRRRQRRRPDAAPRTRRRARLRSGSASGRSTGTDGLGFFTSVLNKLVGGNK